MVMIWAMDLLDIVYNTAKTNSTWGLCNFRLRMHAGKRSWGRKVLNMIILAIITGALSALNYYWHAGYNLSIFQEMVGLIAQVFLAILTVLAAIAYRGQRDRPSYGGGHYRIWTFRFCIIVISLLGNFSILIVFILHMAGVVSSY